MKRMMRSSLLWQSALVMVAAVSACLWWAGGPAQSRAALSLPLPSARPRLGESALSLQTYLSLALHSETRSVLLARVARVDRQAPEIRARERARYESEVRAARSRGPAAYARWLQREAPLRDPDLNLPTLGGRFVVVERLSGPPAPGVIEVDNRKRLQKEREFYRDRSTSFISWRPPDWTTRVLRLGEYWILVWDAARGTLVDDSPYSCGTAWLTGPDDPVLLDFRRSVAWATDPDEASAYASMRRTLLDAGAPVSTRAAALAGMSYRAERRRGGGSESRTAARALVHHTLAELVRQPDLPDPLHIAAITCIDLSGSRELAAGSDEAALLRYLIRVVRECPNWHVVGSAAMTLYLLEMQAGPQIDGKPVCYHFPEVVEALEERHTRDAALGGPDPASAALKNWEMNRRPGGRAAPGCPLIVRHLPAE